MEISGCSFTFSFASPKEKVTKRKRARGDFDFPPGAPFKATRKTASVFLDFSREICRSSKFLAYPRLPFTRRALRAAVGNFSIDIVNIRVLIQSIAISVSV